ncbi:glycogen debranching protein GlgX [Nakamurella sp. A5-74]|uniref:Glycogen debranching protein GlgX n=1 Tax=Nakamurella sp. A5-74 TaxID=3158264 RepID=A0AAU8DJF4_9ACTN
MRPELGSGPERPARPYGYAPQSNSLFPGRPDPLGATVTPTGTNFSVVADGLTSAEGSGIQLCLIDADGGERRWDIRDVTRGRWHAFVPGVRAGQRYGYRVAAHDASKLLLDPYARRVHSTEYDLIAANTRGADTAGAAPLGIVTEPIRSHSEPPRVPWEHTVIYEAHVRGLTALHPEIPAELRGTFAGVAHPAVIAHLRGLGVTTLELLPVHAIASEPGLVATGRRNYWGYSTLSFFAPHPGYASAPGRELAEFVQMVDSLHDAGIEVVLDVVYNHTCEGGPEAPIWLSFRGLAPQTYYLPDGSDLTGCGNTLQVGSLASVRMVTDSLRYWAQELGVDGFRFDLAPVLGRPDGGGFDARGALLTAIATDPVLSQCKLIAEPWDATGDGYAAGRFGLDWAEWNDAFRDDVRDFWRGHGRVTDLAFRLTGSQDRFGDGRRPSASVNFVTAHDGFTLRDLVSYSGKHNQANGEQNRDGTDNNRSDNHGTEGPTDDAVISELRRRQARNLAATLLLSTGTPMVSMGDELWRTQGGNNNAYCQDNPTSWLAWPGADLSGSDGSAPDVAEHGAAQEMLAFFRRVLDVRLRASALHQGEFFVGESQPGHDGHPDLVWFAEQGRPMTEDDWNSPDRRTLTMWVNGSAVTGHGPHGELTADDSWLLVLHAGADETELTLPAGGYATVYHPTLDTSTGTGRPEDLRPLSAGVDITVPGRTVLLLRAERP